MHLIALSFVGRVDHIAFISDDIGSIKQLLDKEKVFYKEDSPAQTGIQQLFFFDPDGNVLEVSNCAPQIGMSIVCCSWYQSACMYVLFMESIIVDTLLLRDNNSSIHRGSSLQMS